MSSKVRTLNIENLLGKLLREAVKGVDLTGPELIHLSNLLKDEGEQQGFTSALEKVMRKYVVLDPKFGPAIADFQITVRKNYRPKTFLNRFKENQIGKSIMANFKSATELELGKTYRFRLFPAEEAVTGEECLRFLEKHEALFMGIQGLALLDLAVDKDKLPADTFIMSFNKGHSYVVSMRFKPNFKYEIDMWDLEQEFLEPGDCVACFTLVSGYDSSMYRLEDLTPGQRGVLR